MKKAAQVLRSDWKFGMKLVAVMLVICGMSATCGAAWMWRSIVDRPTRVVRQVPIHAMVTPRLRVEGGSQASSAVSAAVAQALEDEHILQSTKAIVQLQEQMANMQKDLKNVADTEAQDRTAINRRIDISDTRYSTFVTLVSSLGTLIGIVVGLLTIIEFTRKRSPNS